MITIIKTGKQTNLHYKSNKKGTLYKVFTNAIKAHNLCKFTYLQ